GLVRDTLHLANDITEILPGERAKVVNNLRYALEHVISRYYSPRLKLSLTQRLMLKYLRHCDDDERARAIRLLVPNIFHLLWTEHGVEVAIECIWRAQKDDVEKVLSAFRRQVLRVSEDKFACKALCAVFDSVDDTALVNEYILKEVVKKLPRMVMTKRNKVLQYLVHPRNELFFDSAFVRLMAQGDSITSSDRPRSERYAELFDYVKDPLCTYLADNMRNVMSVEQRGWTLVINTLKPSGDDAPFRRLMDISLKKGAFSALAHILTETFLPVEPQIPCDRTAARAQRVVLVKLLEMDPQQEDLTLSAVVAETVPARLLAKFVYDNQGCWVLYYVLSSLERHVS
ncbi:CPL protein, partial [Aphelenchoides avenae]